MKSISGCTAPVTCESGPSWVSYSLAALRQEYSKCPDEEHRKYTLVPLLVAAVSGPPTLEVQMEFVCTSKTVWTSEISSLVSGQESACTSCVNLSFIIPNFEPQWECDFKSRCNFKPQCEDWSHKLGPPLEAS